MTWWPSILSHLRSEGEWSLASTSMGDHQGSPPQRQSLANRLCSSLALKTLWGGCSLTARSPYFEITSFIAGSCAATTLHEDLFLSPPNGWGALTGLVPWGCKRSVQHMHCWMKNSPLNWQQPRVRVGANPCKETYTYALFTPHCIRAKVSLQWGFRVFLVLSRSYCYAWIAPFSVTNFMMASHSGNVSSVQMGRWTLEGCPWILFFIIALNEKKCSSYKEGKLLPLVWKYQCHVKCVGLLWTWCSSAKLQDAVHAYLNWYHMYVVEVVTSFWICKLL